MTQNIQKESILIQIDFLYLKWNELYKLYFEGLCLLTKSHVPAMLYD
jgi:hypothetical protein